MITGTTSDVGRTDAPTRCLASSTSCDPISLRGRVLERTFRLLEHRPKRGHDGVACRCGGAIERVLAAQRTLVVHGRIDAQCTEPTRLVIYRASAHRTHDFCLQKRDGRFTARYINVRTWSMWVRSILLAKSPTSGCAYARFTTSVTAGASAKSPTTSGSSHRTTTRPRSYRRTASSRHP
jgi:hypothetical protein